MEVFRINEYPRARGAHARPHHPLQRVVTFGPVAGI